MLGRSFLVVSLLLVAGAGYYYFADPLGHKIVPEEPALLPGDIDLSDPKPVGELKILSVEGSKPVPADAPAILPVSFQVAQSQDPPQSKTGETHPEPDAPKQEAAAPVAEPEQPPGVPKGVEVLARGPVHEAFAPLVADPKATKPVSKRPPKPLDEMPPTEKPEGNVLWISGYWAWDEDRNNYLWVSGTWRSPPPGKQWVAGYWREEGENWQWVPGFWTVAAKEEAPQQVTYLPEPPATPETASPGKAPAEDMFFIPGAWVWTGARYQWRAGYWTKIAPGYVWVPDHYRWTPSGYIFIPGYWDLVVSRRGMLYAPVAVDPVIVTTSFYYTPAYAVPDTVVVDALWVRPAYTHYYFGDYYEPVYRDRGFESAIVYSRTNYDSIIVYERYDRVYVRRQPDWEVVQINIYNDRVAGRADRPPRTLIEQNNYINQKIVNNNTTVNNTSVVNNYTVLAPPAQVMAAKGQKAVTLDSETRQQAKQQAVAVQQVALQRTQTEVPSPGGPPSQPRVASLSVPKAQSVTPGFVAPKPLLQQAAKPAPMATTPTRPAGGETAKAPAATTPGVHQEIPKTTATGSALVPHPSDFEAKGTGAAAAKSPSPSGAQPSNHVSPATGGNPNSVAPAGGTRPDSSGAAAAPAVHPSMTQPGASQVPENTGRTFAPPPGTASGMNPADPRAPQGRGNPAVKPPPPQPPPKRPPPKKDQQKDKDR
jgi:hypothetical protein